MPMAVACGSRSGLVEGEVDLPSPDGAADQTVGSETGVGAPIESGSDAEPRDTSPTDVRTDAPTDASEAGADASDVTSAGDSSDATSASDASDATSARDASDATSPDDAGDGEAEASDAGASDTGASDAPSDAPSDACAVARLYVDAVHGSDSASGAAAAPYKTITRAIAVAEADACVTTIDVKPGTYDVANGEVFPLRVPANVSLIGDEAGKGLSDGGSVFILGSGFAYYPLGATVYPGAGATIAGVELTAPSAPPDAGWLYPSEVLLYGPATDVTVRNNTIAGSGTETFYGSIGIYVLGAIGNVIVGNVVTGNNVGVYNGPGASSKLESNVLRGNTYGFEGDYAGADLGGGSLASAGGNTLSCNDQNMWLSASAQPAANNYWDHVPPTTTSDGGHADVYLSPFYVLTPPITTGAMLATPDCP